MGWYTRRIDHVLPAHNKSLRKESNLGWFNKERKNADIAGEKAKKDKDWQAMKDRDPQGR